MRKSFQYLLIILLSSLLLVRCSKNESTPVTPNDPNNNPEGKAITPKDFLSETNYNQLVVEVTYIGSYQPQASSLNQLKSFLETRLHKSAGITIVSSSIASPGKSSYSISDISVLEKQNRTEFASGKKLAAWFVFVDGDYSENTNISKVLGVTYSASSVAIFEKTIKSLSGGFGQPSAYILESTVMEHEFGHILGLVNNGTDMVVNHQDTANGKHCNNKNCLMYYATETSNFVGNLLGGNIPTLDDNCIKDLQNNGGK